MISNLTDSTLTAALLTFFGVIITAGAKHVVDRRADQNLRLDAAMKAGTLLSPSKDAPVSPAAAASGLLALAELGRSKLAVAMLIDLWPAGLVSGETAVLVINKGLNGGREDASLIAAEALCQNAARLDPVKSAHWPSVLDERWVPDAPVQTKILLIEALVEMNTASTKSLNALRSFALRLYGIWKCEPQKSVRDCLASMLEAIVPALEKSPLQKFIYHGREISVSELKAAGDTAERNPDDYFAMVTDCRTEQLREWSSGCLHKGVQKSAGVLASASCTLVNRDAKVYLDA